MTESLAWREYPKTQRFVNTGRITIDVIEAGEGPAVLLLPPLGRSREDLLYLSSGLVAAGYRAIMPEYRGIGRSTGAMEGLTLHDLGDDIAEVIAQSRASPAILLGTTFGSRLARVVATDHPDLVDRLILLAAGGRVPPDPIVIEKSAVAFDEKLPAASRRAALRLAFFAEGNDPSAWETGWHLPTLAMLMAADAATEVDEWWHGGSAPVLIIQGEADIAAPVGNGRLLSEELGARAGLVELPDAGHALVAEQPERILAEVIKYLGLPRG